MKKFQLLHILRLDLNISFVISPELLYYKSWISMSLFTFAHCLTAYFCMYHCQNICNKVEEYGGSRRVKKFGIAFQDLRSKVHAVRIRLIASSTGFLIIFQNGFFGVVQFKISLKKWRFMQGKLQNLIFHISLSSIWECVGLQVIFSILVQQYFCVV